MTSEDKWALGGAIAIAATVTVVGLVAARKAKAAPKIPRPTPDVPVTPPPAPEKPHEGMRDVPPEHLGWRTLGDYVLVVGQSGDDEQPWYWAVFGAGAEEAPEGWGVLFSTRSQIVEGYERAWWDAHLAAERWVKAEQPELFAPEDTTPQRILAEEWGTVISTAWGKLLAPPWLVAGGVPAEGETLGWYTYKGWWIRIVGLEREGGGGTPNTGVLEWAVVSGDATPIAVGRSDEPGSFEDENIDWSAGKAAEWIDAIEGGMGAGGEGAAVAAAVVLEDEEVGAGGPIWVHLTPVFPLPFKLKKTTRGFS